jgi:GT2 family glycosyltransferase
LTRPCRAGEAARPVGYGLSNDMVMDKNTKTIAAIIPTYRRDGYLINTIKGMLSQTRVPDEVIVLDQTPREEHAPETMKFLKHHDSKGNIRLVTLDRPGVYPARNVAAKIANSDILLYLDDDITSVDCLVENHLRHFANPDVSAVAGSILHNQKEDMIPIPVEFIKAPHLVQAFTYSSRFNQPLQNIGFMYAGNFSIRRDVFFKIGGWDEHILTYGDRDLGLRLCAMGYRMDYDPEAKIVHHVAPMGGSRSSDPNNTMPSWQRCVSFHYLAWRHLYGWMFVKYGLCRAARASFLLKRNFLRPHVLPREIIGFVKGAIIAKRWARDGVKSPFSICDHAPDR